MTALFPAGTFAPDPRPSGVARMLAAQYRLDVRLLLRNGEQLLLTMFIPVTLLIGLTVLPLSPPVPMRRPRGTLGVSPAASAATRSAATESRCM